MDEIEDVACLVDDMKNHGLFSNFRSEGMERGKRHKDGG